MQSTAVLTREALVDRTAGRADAVDYLRGIAALMVTLYHANGAFWRYGQVTPLSVTMTEFTQRTPYAGVVAYFLLGFGFLGVQMFFVISGFCIHLPLAAREKRFDVRGFVVRRFFRLYPLYLAVVLVCFGLEGKLRGFGHEPVTLDNFIGHLFLWPYCVPRSSVPMGIVPVLWTLTIEAHFYVLYMLLYPVLRRFGFARAAMAGLLLDIAYRWAWQRLGGDALDWPRIFQPEYFAVTRFGEWLLGAWLAEYFVGLPRKSDLARHRPSHVVWAGALGLAASIGLALAWSSQFLSPMACVSFALLLNGLLTRQHLSQGQHPQARSRLQRIGAALGDRSYSLYLVHFTCITVATTLLTRYVIPTNKSTLAGTVPLLIAIVVGLILAGAVTELAYRFVEKPSHRLAKRLASAPTANSLQKTLK